MQENDTIPQGYFLDGATAQRWPIEVRFSENVLKFRILGEQKIRLWRIDEVVFDYDRLWKWPVIRVRNKNQRVDITDKERIDLLCKQYPFYLKERPLRDDIEVRSAFLSSVLSICVMLVLYFTWPTIADRLAPRIPGQVLDDAGDRQMEFLTRRAARCTGADGQKVLSGLLLRLSGESAFNSGLSVSVYNATDVNAYAVPRNRIIINDGLVQQMNTGDEVAAVLAHELGHIEAGHAARKLARNLGAELLGQLVGVDQSRALLLASYSREMEAEADTRGLALMVRAGISPSVMVDMFRDLEKSKNKGKEGKTIHLLSFLRSHPSTPQREALAEEQAAASDVQRTPLLSPDEWQAVRSMCDGEKFRAAKAKASLGYAGAQAALAAMYLDGKGTEKNEAEGKKWAQKSAETGDAKGAYIMAIMALNQYDEASSTEAFKWMLKAAEQEIPQAQIYVSYMYKYGIGIQADEAKAEAWNGKAANSGGNTEEERAKVAASLAKHEYMISSYYFKAQGVERDLKRSDQHIETAARMGDVEAQVLAGIFSINGFGIAADTARGLQWMNVAAHGGSKDAPGYLASMYRNGIGVPADAQLADMWAKKSAEVGGLSEAEAARRLSGLRPVNIQGTNFSCVSAEDAMRWTVMASQEVLTLDYEHIGSQLPRIAKTFFSPDGWKAYVKALDDSNFVTAISARKLAVTLTPHAPVRVFNMGINQGGQTWNVSFPATLRFTGGLPTAPIDTSLTIQTTCVSGRGYAITQWIAK